MAKKLKVIHSSCDFQRIRLFGKLKIAKSFQNLNTNFCSVKFKKQKKYQENDKEKVEVVVVTYCSVR